jgi:glutamyl-tRNA reductase
MNKFLHGPTHALNQSEAQERADMAALLSQIFHLHPGD